MNNINIDQLLKRYWHGESSLEEEQLLKDYFNGTSIDSEHLSDKMVFESFSSNRNQDMSAKYDEHYWTKMAQSIPAETKIFDLRKWAVAASLVLMMGLGAFMVQQQWTSSDSSTVASAEEALEESEKAILFLAEHFGKGKNATADIKHIKTLGNTIQ